MFFSANKSGEFFGYARMASPIVDDSERMKSVLGTGDNDTSSGILMSIFTPATEWAPRGRIIDDSSRGTLFWEIESFESENETKSTGKVETCVDENPPVIPQSWGRPFKIEWLSANRLPFYRTRGLRNPWNANREVRIARDGTELEPSVGKHLIQIFRRLPLSHTVVPKDVSCTSWWM